LLSERLVTRRRFSVLASGVLAAACGGSFELWATPQEDKPRRDDAQITAEPRIGSQTTAEGEHFLGLDARDAVLRIPPDAGTDPLPLLLLFHGGSSSGEIQLHRISSLCDEAGLAVLAPSSRGRTWDAIRGTFGPDVAFINRALARTFETVSVDPARITAGGFSDGATYALSLGMINGNYFHKILAFSPGFIIDGETHGRPRIFISHGIEDPILPIDRCSRRIVPILKQHGYDVTFREFVGGHEITPAVGKEGLDWAATG
jgi:phospholipase/carboxylesterase